MNDWTLIESIPADCTVFQLCGGGDGIWWAATSAGLMRGQAGHWEPVGGMSGFPVWGVQAARKRLVVSGPTGLVYSVDSGVHWHASIVEQTHAIITCLESSPVTLNDGVLLAGTDGDGMLRSHDGGRRWELCNFGLRSFHVTALAAAPRWGRKEPLLAGLDSGLYFSPNGGRAWLACGLEAQPVQGVAFLANMVAFAAPECGGLWRSLDGGEEWHSLRLPLPLDEAVSVVLPLPGGDILAASGQVILRSTNSGDSWEPLSTLPAPIFSLALQAPGYLLAGGVEAGLWLLHM